MVSLQLVSNITSPLHFPSLIHIKLQHCNFHGIPCMVTPPQIASNIATSMVFLSCSHIIIVADKSLHRLWQYSQKKNNTQDLAKNPLTQGRHCGPTLCLLGNLRIVRCCRCHSLIVDRTVNTFIYQIWKLLSVTYVVSGFNDNATMNVK